MIEWNNGQVFALRALAFRKRRPAPRRVELAKDTLSADSAYRLRVRWYGMLWRSDFQTRAAVASADARVETSRPRRGARARRENRQLDARRGVSPAPPGAVAARRARSLPW